MDLRDEINQIIDESGHYVLLQRTSRKLRCTCWNELYQEADSKCPKCLGLGWVSRIERHKIRRQTAVNIVSLPNAIQQMGIGRIATDTRAFFMRHDSHPKRGDIIMEVGWRGHKPTHMITAHEITYADDMREKDGRIEFYRVTTKEISVDTKIRGFTVRRLGSVQNYEPYK